MVSNLTVAHLFDGIGGFHVASDRAGMETLWVSEIDRHASAVTDHHWPHIKNLGDIHGIATPPTVDVLTGGFPCQDYSVAGTRGGLAGDNGALWWEYLRLIAECRPAWVVGENVPGLLSSRGGRDFQTIVGSLAECGYGVAWAVLDAQYFGVAQRRRRVFIVGHSGGIPRPEILALSEGLFGHPAPSRAPRQDIAPTLGARTKGGGGLGTDTELDGGLIADALETVPTDQRMRPGNNHLIGTFNWQASGDWVTPHSDRTDALHSGQTPAVAFGESGPGWWGEADPTYPLRSEGENRPSRPSHVVAAPSVRRLTPLECERLQGFPDGWTDIPGNSDTQRYRQLGNAVAVPVAEWIMRRIADAS